MDVFDEALLEFWRVLSKHNVAYIMIGGFAVNMHGYIRATKDSDIWLRDDLSNRKNLRQAFAELGYGDYPSLETMTFLPGWTQFYIGAGIALDIMTSMKGLEAFSFDDCYKRARIADLGGVRVPFLHINELIANKRAVARPIDLNDIIELEKIKKLQEETGNKSSAS